MKIYQVDAFTDKVFKGNPAAVCIIDDYLSEKTMLNIAAEMNLSETAFIKKQEDSYSIRWFTPKTEVELCGHATLASAHIIFSLNTNLNKITFNSCSGNLIAIKENNDIVLNFPREDVEEIEQNLLIKESFNTEILFYGKNRMDFFIEIKSTFNIKKLKVDLNKLKKLGNRGVIVSQLSTNKEYDIV